MQVEVVRFNIPTSDGLQTITSPQLGVVVPKAVLFMLAGADVVDDNDSNAGIGWGAVDGTRQWAMFGTSDDGAGTSNAYTVASETQCLIVLHDSDRTVRGEAEFDAFVAGGVRIDWTNAHFDDFQCIAIFFAGADVSVRVDNYLLGAEDVDTNITAPGFRPKLIWCATRGGGKTHTIDTDDGVEDHERCSFGAAVDNGAGYDQQSWVLQDDDNEAVSDVHRTLYNNRVGGRGGQGGADYSVELSNPDASGFSSFTRDASPTGDWMFYVALDFDDDAAVFTYPIPTSSGTQAFTGLGLAPDFVSLNLTTLQTANADGNGSSQANCSGCGAFTDSDEASHSIQNEDGVSTMQTATMVYDRAIAMFRPTFTSFPMNPDASFLSMDADGFTLSFANTGGTPQKLGWGCAIGTAPAAAEEEASWIQEGMG